MKLLDVLQAAKGRVVGGSEFQWKCWPDAQYMDLSDIDGKEIAGCVFSRKNHDVYEVECHVYEDELAYRWIDPAWRKASKDEAAERGVDSKNAYDDVPFIKVKHEDEILKLLTHIVHKTYVHSKHNPTLVAATELLAEEERFAEPWPFPSIGGEQPKHVAGPGMSGEPDDGYDELSDENCEGSCSGCESCDCEDGGWTNPNPYTGEKEMSKKEQYEVVLNVKHVFEVKADSMEDAIEIAKEFESNMKPTNGWGDNLAWMDRYVVKQSAGQRIES